MELQIVKDLDIIVGELAFLISLVAVFIGIKLWQLFVEKKLW